MCPMLLNSFQDGPTMILSPPQDHAFRQFPHQPKLEASSGVSSRASFADALNSGANPFGTSVSPSLTISNKPSRKRSRDDVNAEETPSEPASIVPVAPPAPEEEPIYGEGMTLLNPRTGLALSAESQTGTWYEEEYEKAIAAAKSSASQTNLPSQASRKSQRLDPSAPSLDDIASSRLQRQLQENDSDDNRRILNASLSRSSPFSSEEPLVDDATRLLGISWQRVRADDNDMAAAVRGWKKYIDRQFSQYLSEAEILMKNRALNAYLVSARPVTPFAGPAQLPAYYLFNDDLTHARLVASSWEACLRNLQSSPVVFEGKQILNASDKPQTQQCQNVLGTTPAETGLPLLQTLTAQPASVGLNNSVELGTGMDIDP
ncbi:hypothetical protein AN3114.2 [Aspergillus nidulans FGSC A4]|uniref:Uncharacterized protein n=1 Tax=Emericella nidulans (strain FGSC A4 / ATCC 38163 / CBS 112.46 / NRRL 194 / M139) TaxID=227321 RepID=Q5B8L6_EMENI|nr:hypothetical protein [Aspergillus nidulans FGSC A4]EAA63685.1 hypothetical protein AN3114.2 [Aspergillus nidulans FGSC A4]CBF83381.1 TPA: conserved hypothetical protein [Aspergillus nidulans FGSC A4]|eukprot:XP_660718.1 hypothetical protein AN3114.2 [Aspergillus nidulans FGSC A4]